MGTTMSILKRFVVDEDGATAVEYAFLVTLIILIAAQSIALVGSGANGTFETIRSALPF